MWVAVIVERPVLREHMAPRCSGRQEAGAEKSGRVGRHRVGHRILVDPGDRPAEGVWEAWRWEAIRDGGGVGAIWVFLATAGGVPRDKAATEGASSRPPITNPVPATRGRAP